VEESIIYMITMHPICNQIYIGEHLYIVDSIVINLCLFFSYFPFATIACFWCNKRIYNNGRIAHGVFLVHSTVQSLAHLE